ncbi:hypothetical protein [Morganella morganii]|uniref:hypothetical protein n=1 Tax=Morganella morganii TaxID=582 RepID=UPI0034D75E53
MENYVYMSGVVISAALIVYILVSKRVPSKRKVVCGFVLFTFILGFNDTRQQAITAQKTAEQNSRNSMTLADHDHQPVVSVITGM